MQNIIIYSTFDFFVSSSFATAPSSTFRFDPLPPATASPSTGATIATGFFFLTRELRLLTTPEGLSRVVLRNASNARSVADFGASTAIILRSSIYMNEKY